MRWKVFYVNGYSFSHVDGEPQDAPGGGVVAVVQEDDTVGVLVHRGTDFYVFDEFYGGWYGLDVFGLTQYLMRPGLKIVKVAEAMSTQAFKQMMADIQADPNLPKKSARYSWEAKV